MRTGVTETFQTILKNITTLQLPCHILSRKKRAHGQCNVMNTTNVFRGTLEVNGSTFALKHRLSQNCRRRLLFVCPSVSLCFSICSHKTTHLPIERLLWNIIFGYFFENLSRKYRFDYICFNGAHPILSQKRLKQQTISQHNCIISELHYTFRITGSIKTRTQN